MIRGLIQSGQRLVGCRHPGGLYADPRGSAEDEQPGDDPHAGGQREPEEHAGEHQRAGEAELVHREPGAHRRQGDRAADGTETDHPEEQPEPVRPQPQPLVDDERQQRPERRRRKPEEAQAQEQPPRPGRVPREPEAAPDRLDEPFARRVRDRVRAASPRRCTRRTRAKTTAVRAKVAGAPSRERPSPPAIGPIARARLNVAPSTSAAEPTARRSTSRGICDCQAMASATRPLPIPTTVSSSSHRLPGRVQARNAAQALASDESAVDEAHHPHRPTSARPAHRRAGRAGRTAGSSRPVRRPPRSRTAPPR